MTSDLTLTHPMPVGEPTITLVVPTYRRPELLTECLRAIRAQTYPLFRALICDNSPDREAEPVVASMHDERFVYRPRPRNLGILGNVVAGFQEVQTPFQMEVDDDDLLYPRALERLVAPLLADQALALSFSDIDAVDRMGRRLPPEQKQQFIADPPDVGEGRVAPFDRLAAVGSVYMVATLFRTGVVSWGDIPTCVATAYDRYAVLMAARDRRPAYHVAETLVGYRVHDDGDALRHEARLMEGALAALTAARPYVAAESWPTLDAEILRTRLALARARWHERARGAALRDVACLLRPRSWSPFAQLVGAKTLEGREGRRGTLGRSARRRQALGR